MTITVIVGHVGSGKTMLARKLAKDTSICVVDPFTQETLTPSHVYKARSGKIDVLVTAQTLSELPAYVLDNVDRILQFRVCPESLNVLRNSFGITISEPLLKKQSELPYSYISLPIRWSYDNIILINSEYKTVQL